MNREQQHPSRAPASISIEQAIAMHPDLGEFLQEARRTFERLTSATSELGRASEAGGVEERHLEEVQSAKVLLCRKLDRAFALMNTEEDELRLQVVQSLYSDLLNLWRPLVLQALLERAVNLEPERPHERIMKEADLLLKKARERVG